MPKHCWSKPRASSRKRRDALDDQDYSTAWNQARRASRPVRHVMYGYWQLGLAEFRKAVEESINGKKIEYKPGEVRPYPKPPVIVTASSCPPAISFYTVPEMHIWKDWVKGIEGFRFGPNRVPSGSFDEPAAILSAGWTDVSHQYEHIVKKITVPKKPHAPEPKKKKERPKKETIRSLRDNIQYEPEFVAETDHVLMLSVTPDDPKDIDKLEPYFDFPAAAVLSPAVRVEANNLIRISVLFSALCTARPVAAGSSSAIRSAASCSSFGRTTPSPDTPAWSSTGKRPPMARSASCSGWRATARSISTTFASR